MKWPMFSLPILVNNVITKSSSFLNGYAGAGLHVYSLFIVGVSQSKCAHFSRRDHDYTGYETEI